MESRLRTSALRVQLGLLPLWVGLILNACSSANTQSVPTAALAPAKLNPGISLTGAGVSKGSVTITSNTLAYGGQPMARFNDAWSGRIITVPLGTYDQTNDFGGQNGSMTLVAETQNYPISGNAYPVLVEFSVVPAGGGATINYVNLAAQCTSEGMYDCTSGSCSAHAACLPVAGASAYFSRTDWDQHQIPPLGFATTNAFPHCDSSISGWTNCPAGQSALVSGTYTAKYVLLSNSGNSVTNLTAGIKVTVKIKKDTQARGALASNGGVNVNVILVGDKNINDSHTTAGARNLQLLFTEVNRVFANTGANIGINQLKTYEWSNANGGDQYADIAISTLSDLFQRGSAGTDAGDNGSNINVFLVSNIQSTTPNYSVLGLSGGILGPPVNGTGSSGLAFTTFNKLALYNTGCTSLTCGRIYQESAFLEIGSTISHELGHFLGLNHPTENSPTSSAQASDQLNDTPTCVHDYSGSIGYYMNPRSCYYNDTHSQAAPINTSCQSACNTVTTAASAANYMASSKTSAVIDPWGNDTNSDMPASFCPAVQACQHNHVMWFTTKNRRLVKTGGVTCSSSDVAVVGRCSWVEDGNLFSAESQALVQWDSFLL